MFGHIMDRRGLSEGPHVSFAEDLLQHAAIIGQKRNGSAKMQTIMHLIVPGNI